VGPYLKPPDRALVLCCDEKSQCQALERTQPGPTIGSRPCPHPMITTAMGETERGDPLAFTLDLSVRQSAETLIKGTLDRFGRIDALSMVRI
jgi:hypothetical protein